jgi:oxygen-dependent protoporphyrinogen oxidase
VGGNITSMERDGFIWEEGPNSFQPTDAMLQIAVGLGLAPLQLKIRPARSQHASWQVACITGHEQTS